MCSYVMGGRCERGSGGMREAGHSRLSLSIGVDSRRMITEKKRTENMTL